MKAKQALLSFALSLGLGISLSLTSCSDNDLNTNGGNSDNDNTELTDQEWEKQISLQRLLGAMADVDTLPDNWNSASYIVTPPTIGTAADEATPYSVRLVPTSSTEEAYREYCSYIGKASNGTATTDTWKMDGIGSLTFTPSSEAGLYATVKVNVQQLPQLQEIRFVPASALGNNDEDKAYFYSFGDVIQVDGDYWVCVRPANKSLGLGQTHWCTFQLSDKNFKEVQGQHLVLPTDLGKKEDKSQRMVLNFFNLLRILNNYKIYENENITTFDKFPKAKFTEGDVKTLSNFWSSKKIWNYIVPPYFDNESEDDVLQFYSDVTGESQIAPHILYYGYTGKYNVFSANTYKVYCLDLSKNNETGLFNGSPSTPTIEWNRNENKTLKNIYDNPNSAENYLLINSKQQSYNYTYIVKHRTGGQLQGRFFTDADDSEPTKSFTRSASDKNISDVFVFNVEKEKVFDDDGHFVPYFSFGDMVKEGEDFQKNETHWCIKPASNTSGTEYDDFDKYAYFVSNMQPKYNYLLGEKVSDNDALYIAYQLLRAYQCEGKPSQQIWPWGKDLYDINKLKEYDYNCLSSLKSTLSSNKAIYDFKTEGNKDSKDFHYSLSVNFYTADAVVNKSTKMVDQATVFTIKYYPENNRFYYSKKLAPANDKNRKLILPLYKYADVHKDESKYGGKTTTFTIDQDIRTFYNTHSQELLRLYIEKEGEE